MKKKNILIEEDSPLKKIEVEYPFCFKTKKNKYGDIDYYRYLEDGRFEHISIKELQMNFCFGNHSNTIYALVGDHEFYFKQLKHLHEEITSDEFDSFRDEYFNRYNQYLEGIRYLAKEVEQMISNSPESQRKEDLRDLGIIENNLDENNETF